MKTTNLAEVTHRVAKQTTQLGYTDWDWGEGVAWHGVAETAAKFDDKELMSACVDWMHSHAEFQPSSIRHVMPGLAALTVYRETKDATSLSLAMRVASFLENSPRNVHGVHAESPEIPVWIDYWYEVTPFLTTLSELTGESQYADWAAEQTIAYLMSSWDARSGLFNHAYYDLLHKNSQWFWARSNSWATLASIEMMTDLERYPGLVAILQNVLTRQAARLAQLQDASGLWRTVLDHPTTYLETSASVMTALAFRRGVKRGFLDSSYSIMADRAFEACLDKIDREGNLTGVSGETWPGDILHYAAIPVGVYTWGQGFMALAGLEWMEESD